MEGKNFDTLVEIDDSARSSVLSAFKEIRPETIVHLLVRETPISLSERKLSLIMIQPNEYWTGTQKA